LKWTGDYWLLTNDVRRRKQN